MTLRNYSNTSVETTLASGIDASEVSITVDDATGYPSAPFAIVIDPDVVASEEVMLVTVVADTTFTVTREYDGTTAKAHSAGATVIHAAIAADFTNHVTTSTYATGSLTLAAQPTDGDTITIGSLTFTFTPGGFEVDEIAIGTDVAETQSNTVSKINNGIGALLPDAGALSFSVDVSILVSALAGTAGNGVVTTAVFTDPLNFFGQASLTGGTDGTDSGHLQAQSATLTGSSAAAPVLRLKMASGTDAITQGNVFEIVDSDDAPILNVDSSGAFYTFHDLRMVTPGHATIFSVRASERTAFLRIADTNDAFLVTMEDTPNDVLIFALRPRSDLSARISSHAVGAVAVEVDTFGAVDDNTDLIRAYGTADFNLVFRLMQGGAVVIAQHTAPDDADLNTGDMSLWFDQTPSAAKLMIKAKDSDGTVVTGSVALA